MYLVFDIGGTKMRLATSSDGENIGQIRVVPTPEGYQEGIDKFAQLTAEVIDGMKIEKAAGGITGALNKEKDKYIRSPHLPTWIGQPVKQKLSEIIGAPTFLENDSAMVGLGEASFGAGRGFGIVAYLTISTGIGGARIVNGKIDANIFGFEPGHQIIDVDGTVCPRCISHEAGIAKGELESLVSGSAIYERFGKDPYEFDDESAWGEMHWLLAHGLCNSILHWSPEVVVLGGGVTESGKISVEKIQGHLKEILTIFPEQPQIRKAQLKDSGGLQGALAYLRQMK